MKAGDWVVATGRNVGKIKAALEGIASDNLAIIELDVTDEAQAKEAIAATISRFGRLDVLVNNAGYVLSGKFEALATSQVRQLFDTNFFGVINLMRAALPVMREQRAGHILNVSSVAGVLGMANSSAYASSKFALEELSLSVMHEVAPFGIKLTVVEPGYFRTDLVKPSNIKFGENKVADYENGGDTRQNMAKVHGNQPGDPDKFGDVLVQVVGMETPPRIFVAGSDALTMIAPSIDMRLEDMQAFTDLSKSTDGQF
ncbi:SDR family oxidoreductase [Roseomonas sp. BN140053]|uniref:SDR family oxidoreductase n=1 Tax=Roseomonas sp. BN140053 TaxID=3391898 RepID=UPI0039E8AA0D